MEDLRQRAETYALEASLHLGQKLGFGQDGSVWVAQSARDNSVSAVKVFEREATFRRERDCYQRLLDRGVFRIGEFSIPELIAYHNELWVVEIGIVSPPYLIDFGKAHLDARPDFTEETLADWEAECQERFGERWPSVHSALAALRIHGIHYLDASANKLRFE